MLLQTVGIALCVLKVAYKPQRLIDIDASATRSVHMLCRYVLTSELLPQDMMVCCFRFLPASIDSAASAMVFRLPIEALYLEMHYSIAPSRLQPKKLISAAFIYHAISKRLIVS